MPTRFVVVLVVVAVAAGALLGRVAAPVGAPADGGTALLVTAAELDVVGAVAVAHPWGTEVRLSVDGTEPGARYDVVLVGDGGAQLPAGSFAGAPGTVDATVSVAVPPTQAIGVIVVDGIGAVVVSATVPEGFGGAPRAGDESDTA